MTGLPGMLRGQERAGRGPDGLPVSRLIRAVANADAASFAAAAAALTHASMTVVDRHGMVIASSASPAPGTVQPGGPTGDIVLRDDTGLHGAIRLTSGWPGRAHTGEVHGGLGLALVKVIDSGSAASGMTVMISLLTSNWPDTSDPRSSRKPARTTCPARSARRGTAAANRRSTASPQSSHGQSSRTASSRRRGPQKPDLPVPLPAGFGAAASLRVLYVAVRAMGRPAACCHVHIVDSVVVARPIRSRLCR